MITQLYEIQTLSEAEAMIDLGVDHIGSVILSAVNWKVPDLHAVVRAVAESESKSSMIPLFSDPDTISQALDYYRPDIVHFCETLHTEADCERYFGIQDQIRKRHPDIRIMRAIPIGQTGKADLDFTLEAARIFQPVSDLFLTDTIIGEQPVTGFVGITGKTCDWEVARKLVDFSSVPVILAGGLGPDNVADGIQAVRPYGVDSCSGTNALDAAGNPLRFVKDVEKVERFLKQAGAKV